MTGERVRPSVDVPEEEHSNATSVGYMSQSLSVGGHRLLIEGDGHHSASEYGFSDTDEEGEAEVVNKKRKCGVRAPRMWKGMRTVLKTVMPLLSLRVRVTMCLDK